MADSFVLDSNFFISLGQSHEPQAIEDALRLSIAQGWHLHTSPRVLEEVQSVRDWGSRAYATTLIERLMAVGKVDEGALTALRARLGGPVRSPQDADLSLMVLADTLARRGDRVRLVSDDYKITTASREQGMPYAVVSPSVFLFILSRALKGEEREEARRLFRKVRHGEMEYALSRRDVYNVEEKLTWLMDNLLSSLTTPSPVPAEHESPTPLAPEPLLAPSPTPSAGGGLASSVGPAAPAVAGVAAQAAPPAPGLTYAATRDEQASWAALERHLRGEHVRSGHLAMFRDIMPHLEPLKGLVPALIEVRALADAGELEAALARTHEVLSELKGGLQLAMGRLSREDGQRVLRAYAEMLPDAEMVSALIHVNLGEVVDCEDHLDNVALFALAAGLTHTTIEADYLEALVHAYRESWTDARAQFELTARLAHQAGEAGVEMRCLVGAAVMRFLGGDRAGAEGAMDEVTASIERDPVTGATALEEFGDHFTNFGAAHLASGLYDEALECAVVAGDTPRAERLLGKIRRSHLSMGLHERELAGALRALVDHANSIHDAALQAKYEELERRLGSEEAAMRGPLGTNLPDWSATTALPAPLRGWMDVVRAECLISPEGTLMVCYTDELGLVGLFVRARIYLPGIEQARVRVGDGARVRLGEPPEELRARHGIRGLIVLLEGDPYQLKRALISMRA